LFEVQKGIEFRGTGKCPDASTQKEKKFGTRNESVNKYI
jgi:hypothetical protein